MNNQIRTFENPEFGQLRTVMIDGEPWVVGKDVAAALGYKNPSNAVANHVDDEDKTILRDTQNGYLETKTAYINESGIYSLILSSKLESAKQFKRWVTSEVLPQLRQNGMYVTDELLNNPKLAIKAFQRILDLQNELKIRDAENIRLTEQTNRDALTIAAMRPAAEYVAVATQKDGTLNIRETAKVLKIHEHDLINFLLEKHYLFRARNKRLIPYQRHIDNGYFKVREIAVNVNTKPENIIQTMTTMRGRVAILNTYIKNHPEQAKAETEGAQPIADTRHSK